MRFSGLKMDPAELSKFKTEFLHTFKETVEKSLESDVFLKSFIACECKNCKDSRSNSYATEKPCWFGSDALSGKLVRKSLLDGFKSDDPDIRLGAANRFLELFSGRYQDPQTGEWPLTEDGEPQSDIMFLARVKADDIMAVVRASSDSKMALKLLELSHLQLLLNWILDAKTVFNVVKLMGISCEQLINISHESHERLRGLFQHELPYIYFTYHTYKNKRLSSQRLDEWTYNHATIMAYLSNFGSGTNPWVEAYVCNSRSVITSLWTSEEPPAEFLYPVPSKDTKETMKMPISVVKRKPSNLTCDMCKTKVKKSTIVERKESNKLFSVEFWQSGDDKLFPREVPMVVNKRQVIGVVCKRTCLEDSQVAKPKKMYFGVACQLDAVYNVLGTKRMSDNQHDLQQRCIVGRVTFGQPLATEKAHVVKFSSVYGKVTAAPNISDGLDSYRREIARQCRKGCLNGKGHKVVASGQMVLKSNWKNLDSLMGHACPGGDIHFGINVAMCKNHNDLQPNGFNKEIVAGCFGDGIVPLVFHVNSGYMTHIDLTDSIKVVVKSPDSILIDLIINFEYLAFVSHIDFELRAALGGFLFYQDGMVFGLVCMHMFDFIMDHCDLGRFSDDYNKFASTWPFRDFHSIEFSVLKTRCNPLQARVRGYGEAKLGNLRFAIYHGLKKKAKKNKWLNIKCCSVKIVLGLPAVNNQGAVAVSYHVNVAQTLKMKEILTKYVSVLSEPLAFTRQDTNDCVDASATAYTFKDTVIQAYYPEGVGQTEYPEYLMLEPYNLYFDGELALVQADIDVDIHDGQTTTRLKVLLPRYYYMADVLLALAEILNLKRDLGAYKMVTLTPGRDETAPECCHYKGHLVNVNDVFLYTTVGCIIDACGTVLSDQRRRIWLVLLDQKSNSQLADVRANKMLKVKCAPDVFTSDWDKQRYSHMNTCKSLHKFLYQGTVEYLGSRYPSRLTVEMFVVTCATIEADIAADVRLPGFFQSTELICLPLTSKELLNEIISQGILTTHSDKLLAFMAPTVDHYRRCEVSQTFVEVMEDTMGGLFVLTSTKHNSYAFLKYNKGNLIVMVPTKIDKVKSLLEQDGEFAARRMEVEERLYGSRAVTLPKTFDFRPVQKPALEEPLAVGFWPVEPNDRNNERSFLAVCATKEMTDRTKKVTTAMFFNRPVKEKWDKTAKDKFAVIFPSTLKVEKMWPDLNETMLVVCTRSRGKPVLYLVLKWSQNNQQAEAYVLPKDRVAEIEVEFNSRPKAPLKVKYTVPAPLDEFFRTYIVHDLQDGPLCVGKFSVISQYESLFEEHVPVFFYYYPEGTLPGNFYEDSMVSFEIRLDGRINVENIIPRRNYIGVACSPTKVIAYLLRSQGNMLIGIVPPPQKVQKIFVHAKLSRRVQDTMGCLIEAEAKKESFEMPKEELDFVRQLWARRKPEQHVVDKKTKSGAQKIHPQMMSELDRALKRRCNGEKIPIPVWDPCTNCGGSVKDKKMCTVCTVCYTANFCNSECHKAAWNKHQTNCQQTVIKRTLQFMDTCRL